jgi:hypothetical protein
MKVAVDADVVCSGTGNLGGCDVVISEPALNTKEHCSPAQKKVAQSRNTQGASDASDRPVEDWDPLELAALSLLLVLVIV